MMIERIGELRFTIIAAVCVGAVLAIFVISSMMIEIDLTNWLTINNSLIILSFVPLLVVGLVFHRLDRTIFSLIGNCAIYFLIVMFSYVGGYSAATYFVPERLVWMPFFHRDYAYHGYTSVAEYMNTRNNFSELLILQIFSCSILSVLYLAAGLTGYIASFVTMRIRS